MSAALPGGGLWGPHPPRRPGAEQSPSARSCCRARAGAGSRASGAPVALSHREGCPCAHLSGQAGLRLQPLWAPPCTGQELRHMGIQVANDRCKPHDDKQQRPLSRVLPTLVLRQPPRASDTRVAGRGRKWPEP